VLIPVGRMECRKTPAELTVAAGRTMFASRYERGALTDLDSGMV